MKPTIISLAVAALCGYIRFEPTRFRVVKEPEEETP